VLDHVLVDLIGSIRNAFDRALLERQAVEERFTVDVFLGDVSFETTYSLPGEEQPPRVRADLSIDWPTWSQTAYRSWSIGEPPAELPEAVLGVAVRVQRLAGPPPLDRLLEVLPTASPPIGGEPLARTAVTVEEVRAEPDPDADGPGATPAVRWAVEATYEGSVRLDESQLDKPATLAPLAETLTRWVSSILVRLADLPLEFLEPDRELE